MELETSVSEHYASLTNQMQNFGGDLLACHFGLWGPDTTTDREALLRANHTLVQGCDLGPGRWVLDAGCGVGGTAITLAEAYGVRITGTAYAHGSGRESLPPDVEVEVRAGERVECSPYVPADGATT